MKGTLFRKLGKHCWERAEPYSNFVSSCLDRSYSGFYIFNVLALQGFKLQIKSVAGIDRSLIYSAFAQYYHCGKCNVANVQADLGLKKTSKNPPIPKTVALHKSCLHTFILHVHFLYIRMSYIYGKTIKNSTMEKILIISYLASLILKDAKAVHTYRNLPLRCSHL